MRQVADVLRGRKGAPRRRCIVIPATQAVYKQCIAEGLMDVFLDANCAVSTPRAARAWAVTWASWPLVSAAFPLLEPQLRRPHGRPHVKVYLASPAVAAASAVLDPQACPRILRNNG